MTYKEFIVETCIHATAAEEGAVHTFSAERVLQNVTDVAKLLQKKGFLTDL